MTVGLTRERDLEKKLKAEVEREGALCLKFISPGLSGVPDRVILIPGGQLLFVEMKAPGKAERVLQLHVQTKLRALGFEVFSSCNSAQRIQEVVARVRELMPEKPANPHK